MQVYRLHIQLFSSAFPNHHGCHHIDKVGQNRIKCSKRTLEKLEAVSSTKPNKIKLGCVRVNMLSGNIGSVARRSMIQKSGRESTKAANRPMTSGWVQGYPEEVAKEVDTVSVVIYALSAVDPWTSHTTFAEPGKDAG